MSNLDTRTEILDVAQNLVQRSGLNGMSFQDLSDAVGIRKASVHYHFATKPEMVNALLDRFLNEFGEVAQGVVESSGSGKTRLRRFCDLFHSMLETSNNEKNCLCGMLAAEMFSLDEEGLALVRRFFTTNVARIQEVLQAGVEDGSLQCRGSLRETAEMVIGTLEGGLLVARCHDDSTRLAGVIRRLLAYLSSP